MTKTQKKWHRWLSFVMAFVLLLTSFAIPITLAALVSDPLPDSMAHSNILYALEYLGYNVQWFRDRNLLFEMANTLLHLRYRHKVLFPNLGRKI